MRNLFVSIAFILFALLPARAQDASSDEAHPDTVAVYCSWEALLDGSPDTLIVDPLMNIRTPYSFTFADNDKDLKNYLSRKALAVAYGDSAYFVNTKRLKDLGFKGQLKYMSNYVPLQFNEKIALLRFRIFMDNDPTLLMMVMNGMVDLETGAGFQAFYYYDIAPYFIVDFKEKKVEVVDHKMMSRLLAPYRQLLFRYESMHDYKKTYIINQFLFEYINELEADPDAPLLLPEE